MADTSADTNLDRAGSSVTLELPLPISANEKKSLLWKNRRAYGGAKRKFKRAVWQTAVFQSVPPETPPEHVYVTALLRLHNLRDEDKIGDSLEWVIDALKVQQTESACRFTSSGIPVYVKRGYFVDDDPRHLTLRPIEQVIDRKNKGLTLRIEW